MDEARITTPHSKIITQNVIQAAKEAGGQEHRACVVSSCSAHPLLNNVLLPRCIVTNRLFSPRSMLSW